MKIEIRRNVAARYAVVLADDGTVLATTGPGSRNWIIQQALLDAAYYAWHAGYEAAQRGDEQEAPSLKVEDLS